MIIGGMSITDERKETINFSADYYPPEPSRFVGAAGIELDFNNLKGVKIGVQGATLQANYAVSEFTVNNSILSYESGEQSVADLMSGNIDILLAAETFLEPIVSGSSGTVVFTGPIVILGDGVGIAY
jgi:polar amino acid transport system substrate-binding protein